MGKKAKKKVKTTQKEKKSGVTETKLIPVEAVEDVASLVKEREGCIHLEKGVNLIELSAKDWSLGNIACEDCRENAGDRRGGKGKSKAVKKKGHGGETSGDGKAIWVCLQCGHRACGGVGLPTTPHSHAVRHALQARHPLAVHHGNPKQRWCFKCSTLIPAAKFEEKGEHKDVISDAVKIILNQSEGKACGDVEDNGLTRDIAKTGLGSNSATNVKDYYVVRGIMNLGNTCFFNSVMQNLLAMDELRRYFSTLDGSYGPLTISLKKLFAETSLDTGHKGAVNPKSLFGCICARAPQFRGYQQQDSHELLRCLLDGLSDEELSVRKRTKMIPENGVPPSPDPTFVDAAFGGRVSSTVCCLECGHASTVYEPFLDLSLPVPTKKPPRKTQHASLSKRGKVPVPPNSVKPIKDANGDLCVTDIESNSQSMQEASSVVENTATSPDRSDGYEQAAGDQIPQLQCSFPYTDAANSSSSHPADLDVINPSTVRNGDVSHLQHDKKEDDTSWLDYLDPGTISGEQDVNIEDFDAFGTVDSMCRNDMSIHNTSDDGAPEPFNARTFDSSGNFYDDEVPQLVQDCQVLLLPYKEESLPNIDVMEGQASSSLRGQDEDAEDFCGFGDLFDEPEQAFWPSPRPDNENSLKDGGAMNSFCSESDPDEVDDSSPATIETCLKYFTKPELLSKEQGWYCEKCSKVVQCRKRKSKGKNVTSNLNNRSNDLDADLHADAPRSEKSLLSSGKIVGNGVNILLVQNGDVIDDKSELSDAEDKVDSLDINGAADRSSSTDEPSSPIRSDSIYAGELNLPSAEGEDPEKDLEAVSGNQFEQHKDTESSYVKVARDAIKTLLIEKVPTIVTIHLKRFSQDARGRLSKLNGHVAFGETIDLRPYMNPRCTDEGKRIYRLSGIVEHSGTMRGGHYIAYIRGKKNTWYHASDAYIREASFEEVLRSEAYILFYKKD